VQVRDGQVHPFIRGSAHVTLQGSLVIDGRDPFAWGITAERLDAAVES
jgi:proline racemase